MTAITKAEYDRDALRPQPARHERQRLGRRLIQPLRVVDEADLRELRGSVGQQAEHPQRDHEPVGGTAALQPERHGERVALRSGRGRRARREGVR